MYEPFENWDSLLTKDYLDRRLAPFEEEFLRDFRRATVRLVLWTVAALVAGLAVYGASD